MWTLLFLKLIDIADYTFTFIFIFLQRLRYLLNMKE